MAAMGDMQCIPEGIGVLRGGGDAVQRSQSRVGRWN